MRLIAGLLFAASVTAGTAAPWTSIEKSKTIKIATEGAFPPFNVVKGKDVTGFEVDVGKAIAKKLGLKDDWKTTAFDSLLIGLNQNRYDLVIASHGITNERRKAVDFTDPHYCTGGIIVSRPGGPKTVADLKGKIVGVQVGSTYLENVKKVAGVKDIKTFPKDTDMIPNLAGKRVDAWITDKFVAKQAQASAQGKELQTGDMLFTEQIGMAVAKGNDGLKDKINAALAEIRKDGSYIKISQQYFNEDISCK